MQHCGFTSPHYRNPLRCRELRPISVVVPLSLNIAEVSIQTGLGKPAMKTVGTMAKELPTMEVSLSDAVVVRTPDTQGGQFSSPVGVQLLQIYPWAYSTINPQVWSPTISSS